MRGKKHIITIIVAGIGLVGFIVALCFVFCGPRELNDNYFINSDRRIVSSMENPSTKLMFGAKTMHRVYEVDGNKVTSYKVYYAFENAGAASEKFDEVRNKSLEDMHVEDVVRDGKYVIVIMDKMTYEKGNPAEIREVLERINPEQIPIDGLTGPNYDDPTEGIDDTNEKDE